MTLTDCYALQTQTQRHVMDNPSGNRRFTHVAHTFYSYAQRNDTHTQSHGSRGEQTHIYH